MNISICHLRLDPSVNSSFVPATSSAPSVDPSIVPRLIPSYVTNLEPRQDSKLFPVQNKPHTILILDSIVVPCVGIQRDPVIVSDVGPIVAPDTGPSVDSNETPIFDPKHHQETSSIPYVGCNFIPILNTRYSPSSSLFYGIFFSSGLTPSIQFKLSLFKKASSSTVYFFNGALISRQQFHF